MMIDRAMLMDLLGPFPSRVPLDAHTLEISDCGSYLREKVSYCTEGDERISAYVCIPKERSAKTPAVFCHHQHNSEFTLGKSEVVGLAGNPDQAYALELAQRGFITFAPDAIAFEERNWSGGTFEAEYYELASRLVRGQTLLAKVLHDASVGVDYLVTRPDVDPDRIGFLGHSYGGRMAIWLPALDRRIRATVSHCGCVGYADSLRRGVGIQMEFCLPGFMHHAEIEDIVALVAPTPLLLSAATEDRWSRGAQRIYEAALPAFANSDLQLLLWPGGHAFTRSMRDAAYRFLEEHLYDQVRE
jgi:dienelactone hydrolase